MLDLTQAQMHAMNNILALVVLGIILLGIIQGIVTTYIASKVTRNKLALQQTKMVAGEFSDHRSHRPYQNSKRSDERNHNYSSPPSVMEEMDGLL